MLFIIADEQIIQPQQELQQGLVLQIINRKPLAEVLPPDLCM